MAKKLLIDLANWDEKKEAAIRCSYYHHPGNNGTLTLRELATFALICRRCEAADCVKSCPREALEKQPDGVVKRYNMRCISCKSCANGCPFGTILPELLPFAVSQCDYCFNRLAEGPPLCALTSAGAVQYVDVVPDPKQNLYGVGEHMVVRCVPWVREEGKVKK